MAIIGTSSYNADRWGKRRKINIEMEGNWDDIDRLIALLKHWQGCGGIGHCAKTCIIMDGDGSSHPKFSINNKNIQDIENQFFIIRQDKYQKSEDGDLICIMDVGKIDSISNQI